MPLYFERLSGYNKSLELEPMILRLITVITGPCYSRRSCSLPVRLNLKGPWSRGIVKACSFCKNSQEQEDLAVLENRALVRVQLYFSLKLCWSSATGPWRPILVRAAFVCSFFLWCQYSMGKLGWFWPFLPQPPTSKFVVIWNAPYSCCSLQTCRLVRWKFQGHSFSWWSGVRVGQRPKGTSILWGNRKCPP